MNSRCVKKWLIFFFMLPIAGFGQLKKYPVFDECEGETINSVKDCFYKMTKELFYDYFQEPPIIKEDDF